MGRRELLLSLGQGVGESVLPLLAGVVAVPADTLMQSGFLSFLDKLFCDWPRRKPGAGKQIGRSRSRVGHLFLQGSGTH